MREYGTSGPRVVVVHGGPGAPGYMAPVARALSDSFRILEPFQRVSGGVPLTVERHIADLDQLVASRGDDSAPALVGHSWGAMLALAYAAAHPRRVASIALIGCGTFDRAARERMREVCEQRMSDGLRQRLDRLPVEFPDPDARLKIMGELLLPLYSHELLTTGLEVETCDARANHETWQDMLRLQEEGIYPEAFTAIDVPVIMLHGAVDPHPGGMIERSLRPHLHQLEYREWKRCGHYPWLEKEAHDEFFIVLREWLARHSPDR